VKSGCSSVENHQTTREIPSAVFTGVTTTMSSENTATDLGCRPTYRHL